jgi:hypothetical protein
MKSLVHVFVTLACFALFSCQGSDRIPESYFGTYRSNFGEAIEISNSGIRISGFRDIGAHDQTLNSSFEGFREISEGIWNQQPGVYVEPVLTSWSSPPYGEDDITPDSSLQDAWPPIYADGCSLSDPQKFHFSDKIFRIYLATDMDLHYSESEYHSIKEGEMKGKGSLIGFNVDTTVQKPVSQLKVYMARTEMVSIKASSRCSSFAHAGLFMNVYPTYFHRVQ